jgi:hypothetical protein
LVLSPDSSDLVVFEESAPRTMYAMDPTQADRERLSVACHPKNCGAEYPLSAESVFTILVAALEHDLAEVSLDTWLRYGLKAIARSQSAMRGNGSLVGS